MDKMKCPGCGRQIELKPHPDRPWRMVGWCECHPQGPVIETDFVAIDEPSVKNSKTLAVHVPGGKPKIIPVGEKDE